MWLNSAQHENVVGKATLPQTRFRVKINDVVKKGNLGQIVAARCGQKHKKEKVVKI